MVSELFTWLLQTTLYIRSFLSFLPMDTCLRYAWRGETMSFLSFVAPPGSPQSWPHPKSLRKIHPSPETTMKQNHQGLQTLQRKEELRRHGHPPPPAARLQPFFHLFTPDRNRPHCPGHTTSRKHASYQHCVITDAVMWPSQRIGRAASS